MRNVIFFCCFRKPLGGQSTLPQTRDFHFTAPQARAPLHGGRRMKIGSEFRRGGGRKVTSDQWPVTSDQRPVTGDQWPVTSASATAGARGASLRASARSACPEGDRKAPLPPPPLSHSWRSTPELTIEPRDGGGLNPAGARCGSAVDGTAVFFSPFLFCYFLITHIKYTVVSIITTDANRAANGVSTPFAPAVGWKPTGRHQNRRMSACGRSLYAKAVPAVSGSGVSGGVKIYNTPPPRFDCEYVHEMLFLV